MDAGCGRGSRADLPSRRLRPRHDIGLLPDATSSHRGCRFWKVRVRLDQLKNALAGNADERCHFRKPEKIHVIDGTCHHGNPSVWSCHNGNPKKEESMTTTASTDSRKTWGQELEEVRAQAAGLPESQRADVLYEIEAHVSDHPLDYKPRAGEPSVLWAALPMPLEDLAQGGMPLTPKEVGQEIQTLALEVLELRRQIALRASEEVTA